MSTTNVESEKVPGSEISTFKNDMPHIVFQMTNALREKLPATSLLLLLLEMPNP
jgi:hypothetical protein